MSAELLQLRILLAEAPKAILKKGLRGPIQGRGVQTNLGVRGPREQIIAFEGH